MPEPTTTDSGSTRPAREAEHRAAAGEIAAERGESTLAATNGPFEDAPARGNVLNTVPGQWALHRRGDGYRVFANQVGIRVKADAAVSSTILTWYDLHELERVAREEDLDG